MKLLTKICLFLHFIFVTCFMWGAPHFIYLTFKGCQSTKYYVVWLFLLGVQFFHWKLLKRECILSLIEKISEDPTYVMGADPAKSHLWGIFKKLSCNSLSEQQWIEFHYQFTKMNVLMCIGIITLGNSCFKDHRLLKSVMFVL